MRAVIQRVSRAEVRVGGALQGSVGAGLCVLLGVAAGDSAALAERLAGKVARLRIFEEEGRFQRSLLETGGRALVVSQFTLLADYRRQEATGKPTFAPGWKGNRPSFLDAAPPEEAEALYGVFCDALAAEGIEVARGVFGARMEVELVNDGPVTLILDA